MTASTQEILLDMFVGPVRRVTHKVAAATKLEKGWLVGVNGAGYLVAVTEATGIKMVGVLEHPIDNSAGADGDKEADVLYGAVIVQNDSVATVDITDLGTLVYGHDNQTIGNNATGRSPVGYLIGFDDGGLPILNTIPRDLS